MPSKELTKNNLEEGYTILDALTDAGFIKSNSEGRRLIQEKCVSVNDIVVEDFKLCINSDMFTDGEMLLRRGKKKYFRFILK